MERRKYYQVLWYVMWRRIGVPWASYSPSPSQETSAGGTLKRIQNINGEETKRLTKRQKMGTFAWQNTGSAIQKSCFMCRKYLTKCKFTSFCCSCCGIPLCQPLKDFQPGELDGWTSCVQEHLNSGNDKIRCENVIKHKFPSECKQHLTTDWRSQ